MAQRVNLGQTGLPVRKKTFVAKSVAAANAANYIINHRRKRRGVG